MTDLDPKAPRKPRLAIMGEFSAGKSTLTNLFLGKRPLPEKVTATRLAPVWIAKGDQAPYRETLDGTHEPISLDALGETGVEDTRSIRLFFEADVLELCDIIDFPGISDPNMDAEVWQRVLSEVDIVLWCTHATQAWRQSEAAVWASVPAEVRARSLLLVTRFDKLTTERDQKRVLARLAHETKGKFAEIFPMSLLQALNAGKDFQAWEQSGAAAMLDHLSSTLMTLGGGAPATAQSAEGKADNVTPISAHRPESGISDIQPVRRQAEGTATVRRVVPRRVAAPGSSAEAVRPGRPTQDAS